MEKDLETKRKIIRSEAVSFIPTHQAAMQKGEIVLLEKELEIIKEISFRLERDYYVNTLTRGNVMEIEDFNYSGGHCQLALLTEASKKRIAETFRDAGWSVEWKAWDHRDQKKCVMLIAPSTADRSE